MDRQRQQSTRHPARWGLLCLLALLWLTVELGCTGTCWVRGSQCRTSADCQGRAACICGSCSNDRPCPSTQVATCEAPCPAGMVCDCGRCRGLTVETAQDGGPEQPPDNASQEPAPASQPGQLTIAVSFLAAQEAAVTRIKATVHRDQQLLHELSLDKEGGELWETPRWRSLPLSVPAGQALQIALVALDQAGQILDQQTLSGLRVTADSDAALFSVMRLPVPPSNSYRTHNRAPQIIGVFVSSTKPMPGETIDLWALAQDAPTDRLTYHWHQHIPAQGTWPGADQSETSLTIPKDFAGKSIEWTLRVEDQGSGRAGLLVQLPVGNASASLPFGFRALPHIDELRASRVAIEAEGRTDLTAIALTHGPRARLSYRWEMTPACAGSWEGQGASISWLAPKQGLPAGGCRATVTVSDGDDTQRADISLSPSQQSWHYLSLGDRVDDAITSKDGHIYIKGRFRSLLRWGPHTLDGPTGQEESFVAKLDAQGNTLWLWHTRSSGDQAIRGMAVDATGALYLTGAFTETLWLDDKVLTSQGETDIFALKLSPSGQVQHAIRAGGPAQDAGESIAISADGSVYLGGRFGQDATFQTTSMENPLTPTFRNRTDIFIAKLDRFDESSKWLWVRDAGAGFSFTYETTTHLALTSQGDVLAVGVFGGNATFGPLQATTTAKQDMFVAKLSPEGKWLSLHTIDGKGVIEPKDIVLDANDRLYIIGAFNDTIQTKRFTLTANQERGNDNMFLMRLDPTDGWKWGVSIVDTYETTGFSVALGPQGHLYIVGTTVDLASIWSGTLEPQNRHVAYLGSLTTDGTWRWRKPALELRRSTDLQFLCLTALPTGDLIIGGRFRDGFTFAQKTYTPTSPAFRKHAFILRHRP